MTRILCVDYFSRTSGVRLDHAVDDLDAVASAPRWRARFMYDAARPVLKTNGDLVALARLHPLLDFIAGDCAAHNTDHGRDVLPASAPDLVAENAAHDRSADRTKAGSFALRLDLAHRFDHAAFGASHLRRRLACHLRGDLRRRGMRSRGSGLCRHCRVRKHTVLGGTAD